MYKIYHWCWRIIIRNISNLQDRETSDEDDQEHFEVEDDRAPIVRNTFADDQPTFSSTEPTNSYAQI